MTHQKWTVLFLLFVSFSAVLVSVTSTAHAQSSQSIVPTITLASHPCNSTDPDPDCLVGVTTSVKFKIHFSSSIDADTFTGEDIISSDIDGGTMVKDRGQFIYYAYVFTERTVTIQIPADAVSDTLGNTNSAAQLTVRIDRHNPTIMIPEEYLDAYDGYTQAVQIKQPYEEPNIICVDKVYERVSEDDIFIRNDYYDAVPNINATTNFEPEDLPKIFNVHYTCLDAGHRIDYAYLDVILVEDLSVFNTPPALLKIERFSSSTQTTDSQTLTYTVYFSNNVVGVDQNDFVLSPSSTGIGSNATHPVTNVSPVSNSIYYVTISVATDGTYNLDLVPSGHGITDIARKPLTSTVPTGADETYTVGTTVTDTTNPRLASIERYSPASRNTDSQSLVYKATFSESVTGVNTSDFVLSPSSTGGINGVNPVTAISGSGDTYYVTVSSTVDGTYNLDLVSSGHNIADASSNPLTNTAPTGADQTYIVSTTVTDTANPRLASIERYSPASRNTDSQSLVYKATFSESVTGVNTSDFVLSPSSTGGINGVNPVTAISGSGDTYYVTVSSTVDGTYNLDLVSSGHNIADASSNPLTNTAPTGADQTYIVSTTVTDTANPRLASIERYSPASRNTDSQSLVYKATFSESVTGVNTSDFVLSPSSTGGINGVNPVTAISGSGDTYYVTVSSTVDGTYNLDLVSSGHNITDASSNPLTNTAPTGADQTYIVSTTVTDTANPRLASIERYSPASRNTDSQSLVYKATFSESVTGVNTSDFVLSPDSTGGEDTTSTGQFTQTRSPNLAIPYDATVSDTITVPDSETATSVSVAIDITHTYIGDLKIDLIAPDGTTKTLHNYSDGGEDDIDQTYAPSFGSIPISGVWTLQIHDNYYADSGVLNSWTLTINYGDTATTVSSVTDISGSGDVYYVTVSATQDGTYNLDLISSGHGIADTASNSLTNTSTTGADETYTVSTAVIDDTAPTLESIQRYTPATENTDNQTLVYKATFSENVTGVDVSDFILSPDSAGGTGGGSSPVTDVSGSGDVYYVTVSATQDGTYNLDLVSSGHDIADTASNSLTNTSTTGADETYTVSTAVIDDTAPTLESIQRYTPATENTDNQTLVYKATFSENVTGVDVSDFILSPDSAGGTGGDSSPVTDVSGSGDVYSVTVFASTNGTYNLDLISSGHGIADTASNSLTNTSTTGADETYTVSTAVIDDTAPTLESIERYNPASQNTTSRTLIYMATFSENVTGVDASDFILSPDSTWGGNTSASTGQFTHTRSPNLTIPDLATVSDTITVPDSETATSVSVEVDITHNYIGDLKIDIIAPDGTSITLHDNSGGSTDNIDQPYAPLFGSIPISGVWTLQIHDNYDADPGVLNSWTLTINYGDTATTVSSVTDISGSGDVYYVTVSATQDGTYNLDLVSSGHDIADTASNSLTNTSTTGADETYTVSTAVIDDTAPTLESIQRYTPATENTDNQTLVYKATFSENVTGVDVSDFILSPDSAGGTGGDSSPVTDVSGSGDVYSVTVFASTNGTYNLDLISSGHGIADTASNSLTNTSTTGADETYTVSTAVIDDTAPTLESIERYNPASQNTTSRTLIYMATFSENVTGVDASDFILSPDSTWGGNTSASTGQFTHTRSPNLTIPDLATVSDTITVPDSETATSVSVEVDITHNYIGDLKIDIIAPDGTSITLHDNSGGSTDNIDQPYAPLFGSIPISGVWTLQIHDNYDADPGVLNSWTLTINYGDTATTVSSVTDISGSGDVYYVTVSATQDGTYNLDLVSSGHDIADTASNSLTNTSTTGADETYTVSTAVIDDTAPTLESIQRYTPATENTDNQTLVYKATFSENVTGVDVSDFILSPDSAGGTGGDSSPVTDVSGSGDVYSVTVFASTNGTYNLDLISSGHGIADTASNSLTNTSTTGADETYTVSTAVIDDTAPTLESIERYNPASQNTTSRTLIYMATFSENVTGVDASDFILSPDSTWGGNTSASTGQFTHTRSPNLTIPDLATVSDTITVPDSETATSVSVEVDITHNYIGDLKIDIIAPDGTSITLHDNSGGSTDNIDQPYAPLFGSIPISGVWTLQIHDNYDADPGVLNSWTLTINYGDTATTVSSVTDISGSGDVYYVTVSATQDGTYNLDLVSSGHDIADTASNSLTNTSTTGADETYTVSTAVIDDTAPTLESIQRYTPATENTDNQTLVYKATFSENVTGVDVSDFILSPDSAGGTGGGSSPVTDVSGSGDVYSVTVFASTNGTYNLDLISSGHGIADTASNSLTNTSTTGADETYTVSTAVIDDTAPTLESIQRYTPATENTDNQTLVYKATFSENVTGVDVSDFILSPDSTWGGNTSASTGQFTHTRSPNLTIPDLATVSDTITVPDSETATSVSVEVDITHNYIGDLKIDIIAPDGTSITLHDNSGGSTDNIDQPYAPLFGSIPISGVWTLQIHDNYDADLGVLNSWTLTINYGDTATTVSSVTDISGSGDVYYVTVSATQDGTYNLDLVSSGHDIADTASNSLTDTSTTGADETYTVSTAVIDDTAPTLESIQRYTPATENTDNQTLVYKATFSESVTGVNTSDFVLSPSSTGGINGVNPVTAISGSGDTYYVTVSSTVDGTYNLDLISSGHNIADASSNPLTNTAPTGADQTYIVSTTVTDTANPRLASIERYSPASRNTDSQSLVYKATFSESVTGVNTSDFVLSPSSTGGINGVNPVTAISGSDDTYYVTVSSTVDGTYNLDLVSSGHNIADASSNPLTNTVPTGTDETYIVSTTAIDTTNPRLASIERSSPTSQNTDSQSLIYEVTFSESVTGVTSSDFILSPDSTGGGTTTISAEQFTQTRSPNLAIPDLQTVSDTITVSDSGTATSVSVAIDITHTYIGDLKIDLIAPDGTTRTLHNRSGGSADDIDQTYAPSFGSIPISGVWTLQIHDNYYADSGVLNSWTLTINYNTTTTTTTVNPVTGVSGSDDTYYVTVSSTVDGTYNLDLISSGHNIADTASNPLTNTVPTGTDETYIVSTAVIDDTTPTLESIQRYTPATENTDNQTLVYKATFSESVTGVDASDFILSPDSTWGGNTSASTGQFTHTRSPNLTIPDLATVSDTITVPDSETATSVSVEVDITHNYIGDLKIDIIAPDGTSITLHDNSGGSTDNIDQPYAPLFGSIPISGVWTLQIHDNYDADPGVLNSWTLTINYGDTATTVSSVTDISGSGDVYYVTVSATQDGTYNLDLISSGHGIADTASNSLTNTSTTGADETYTVSTAVIDDTAPTLESIQRYTPATENTDNQTLVYKATFSENVTGVDASDFILSPDSAGGTGGGSSPVTDVSGSGDTYYVTVSSSTDGTYNLDLVSSGHGIADTASNSLTDTSTTGADETYTVSTAVIDDTAPTLESIQRYTPATENTDNQTLVYKATFSESVTGVNTSDFVLSPGSTGGINGVNPVTAISGSGDTYYVTVSSTVDGTYNLDLVSSGHNIADASSNPLTNTAPTGADQTYIVSITVIDTIYPRLESIERYNPASQNTDSQSLVYKATFSESVTGVNTSDFVLSPDSTGGGNSGNSQVTAITSSGSVYYVTVSAAQDGTYNLDLVLSGHGIEDTADNPLINTVPATGTDETYTVSTTVTNITAPTLLSIERYNQLSATTSSRTLIYEVTFSENVTGVYKAVFVLSPGSTGGTGNDSDHIVYVSGSGSVYNVIVIALADGTYNLDLVSSGHGIVDTDNNPLTYTAPTTGIDETYIYSTAN